MIKSERQHHRPVSFTINFLPISKWILFISIITIASKSTVNSNPVPRITNGDNRYRMGNREYGHHEPDNTDPTNSSTIAQSNSPTGFPTTVEPSNAPSTIGTTTTPSSAPTTLVPTDLLRMAKAIGTKTPTLTASLNETFDSRVNNVILNRESFDEIGNGMLATNMNANLGSFGNVFNIRALKKMVVTSLSFYTDVTTEVEYFIYTSKGHDYDFADFNLGDWTLVCNGTVYGRGKRQFTPVNDFSPIFLEEGEVQGLYVTLASYDIRYSNTTTQSVGDIFTSNDDLEILVGGGIGDYPVPLTVFVPRLWHGSIEYFVWSAPSAAPSYTPSLMPSKSAAPSLFPSIAPSPHENIKVISTEQIITLFGEQLELLDTDGINTFGDSVKEFLMELVVNANPTTQITDVIIDGQSVSNLPTARRFLNDQSAMRSLDIRTSITGKYTPPPEINFDTVVEESIETKGEKLVTKLQKSSIKTFQQVKQVRSVAIVTESKSQAAVSNENDAKSFAKSPLGYAIFSLIGMFALCICVVCCRLYCIYDDEDDMYSENKDDIFGMNRKTFDDLTDIMAERYAQQEYSHNFYTARSNNSSGMMGGGCGGSVAGMSMYTNQR